MAKKFILIDQSISSLAGHHYEYAAHVLEAAQRAGYEVYLATHQRFAKSAKGLPWRTFPYYRFGFWASQEAAQFGIVNWTLGTLGWLRFRWRLFYHYSLFGLLWAVRDRFGDFLLKQPMDRTHVASLITLIPAALFVKLLRWLGLLLLFPVMLLIFLCRATARLLKAGGFPKSYVKSLLADAVDAYSFASQIWRRRTAYLKWWQQYRSLVAFRKDTERLLQEVTPGAGDIVFFPTISGVELIGLADSLKGKAPGPSWHVLFRRDIFPGRETGYGLEEWRAQGLRNSLLACMAKTKGHDVRFYTDTEELTAQYNHLGTYRFETVAIPHTHQITHRSQAHRQLRVIYVGDARREKGYHAIPKLVEDLWANYVVTGKVSFHLQSNFNIPQGEPEAVVARQQLELMAQRKPGSIELFTKPMTSQQYKEFLLSGDINLLLYDSTNYYARSSGILVESLSAGMPVIVPAASWLSRQFRSVVVDWQRMLRQRLTTVRAFQLKELRWQVQGNVKASAWNGAELTSSRDGKVFTQLRYNGGATCMLVDLQFGTGPNEGLLLVEQLDGLGNPLAPTITRLIEGGADRTAVELIDLDAQTVRIQFAIASAPPAGSVALTELRIDLLVGKSTMPRSVVGVTYQEPSEIPAMLRELVDHYQHYRATAGRFAEIWGKYHNAERLIEELEGKTLTATAKRAAG